MEISLGKNRTDTKWQVKELTWAEFVQVLKQLRRTYETLADYDRMTKDQRDQVKNGKAFVGGPVRGGRRRKEAVECRWLITLDADNADEDFIFMADLVLSGTAYAIYSTHSSRPQKLKYRLVIPTDRAMSPDEHAAVARQLAYKIGLNYFDKTTFDVHRLMYLPSCSKDATPVLDIGLGLPLAVDGVLAEYEDWRDVDSWPRHENDKPPNPTTIKLGNPADRAGVLGTFCQAYSITETIDLFLEDIYLPTVYPNRFTYSGGSSSGGLLVYDDLWAYSQHQTDPANTGHCVNAFDLVRIHKFRHLDADSNESTPTPKLPSYKAMMDFAAKDLEVRKLIMSDAAQDFAEEEELLEVDPKTGRPYPNSRNAEIILRTGAFAGILAYDAFGNTEVVQGDLPWRKRRMPHRPYESWLGDDDIRLLHHFSCYYGFQRNMQLVKYALVEVTRANSFHPVKEYLESFAWDGIRRLDWLFCTYLGADRSEYVKAVTRKMFVAAVKRVYEPGVKFDQMLVLIGPQGVGKSSLLAKMGGKWFSDSLKTFDNKEAGEHLQSSWIFEIGELSAMRKAEIEEVKAFLSKTNDKYRVAYDRMVSEFPRKCVFFGTTNTRDFLKDVSGNRRFWPVDVNPAQKQLDHWEHLDEALVGQLWAEAVQLYRAGEELELSRELQVEAERQQEAHIEEDPRVGLVRVWLEAEDNTYNEVCALQVWVEGLGYPREKMRKWDAREICDILRGVPGWTEMENRVHLPRYGYQTTFVRNVQRI